MRYHNRNNDFGLALSFTAAMLFMAMVIIFGFGTQVPARIPTATPTATPIVAPTPFPTASSGSGFRS